MTAKSLHSESAMCILTVFYQEGHLPKPETACWIKSMEYMNSKIQMPEVYFLKKLLHLLIPLHTEDQMAAQIFSRS